MYQTILEIDDVINVLSSRVRSAARNKIVMAFEYAKKKHEGQFRKTGEAYIMHPLRVSRFVAEWGFEGNVVCAALLHDVVEDCDTPLSEIQELFGKKVADMVDALTAVDASLKQVPAANDSGISLDTLSDIRLQHLMFDRALFIKVADRLDNLNTISGMPPKKQYLKAQHTREILVPMLIEEGAFELANTLEDLCFRIEHKEYYEKITKKCDDLRAASYSQSKKLFDLFETVFDPGNKNVPAEVAKYQPYIADYFYTPCTANSTFRRISKESDNLKRDFDTYLSRHHISQYDTTLIIKNEFLTNGSHESCFDLFMAYYEAVIKQHGIGILKQSVTSLQDSTYFVLYDEMDNRYRLFVKTENEYLHYRLGNIVDTDHSLAFQAVNEIDPRDTYKKKIKVFAKNGQACYIDTDATVLDFAFMIDKELGLRFSYATIGESDLPLTPDMRLHEGDMVIVHANPEGNITATIDWFNYAKTSTAVHYLVQYFKKHGVKPEI